MPRHTHFALCIFVIACACNRGPTEVIKEVPVGDGGAGGHAGENTDSQPGTTPRGGFSGQATTEGTTAVMLDEDHPGYGQPACLDCHGSVAPLPHTDQTYRAPDCASCHGGNGAPTRDHAVLENTGCANCHSSVDHVPNFTAPTDCVSCHKSE